MDRTSVTTTEGVREDEKSKDMNKGKGKGKGKGREESAPNPPFKRPPPHVSVAAIVGGMSSQKQHRVLSRGVDVLVATPGRLWDILEDVCVHYFLHANDHPKAAFRMTIWREK